MKPLLQAMVLADQVYQDRTTGKMIIAGTFTRLIRRKVTQKPGEKPPFGIPPGYQSGSPHAYIRMTEVHGAAKLELRFVDLATNQSLFQAALDVRSNDPLQSIEMNVPLPQLPMPQPGRYSLELLHEGELLGAWNISLEDQDVTGEPPANLDPPSTN